MRISENKLKFTLCLRFIRIPWAGFDFEHSNRQCSVDISSVRKSLTICVSFGVSEVVIRDEVNILMQATHFHHIKAIDSHERKRETKLISVITFTISNYTH